MAAAVDGPSSPATTNSAVLASRIQKLALLALMVVGAVVRVRTARTEPVGRDEAQTVALSRLAFPSGILEGLRHDGNAPAYYLVEHFFTAPRGVAHRELRDRVPALVCGLALIPLAFALGRRLGGPLAGLTAAALVALAPIEIEYATQARMYSMLAACSVGLCVLLLRALEDGSWRNWAAYGALALVSLYVHSFAVWMLVGLGIAGAIGVARRPPERLRWLATHAAVGLAFVPGLLFVGEQIERVGSRLPWAVIPGFRQLGWQAMMAPSGVIPSDFPGKLAAAVGALGIVLLVWSRRRRAAMFLGAVIVALGAALGAAQSTAAFEPRYNIGPLTVTLVLAGAGIGIAAAAGRLVSRVLAGAAFVALVGLQVYANGGGNKPKKPRSAARDAARILLNEAGASDVIVTVPDSVAVSLNYYLPPGMKQLDPPTVGRVDVMNWQGWQQRLLDPGLERKFEDEIKRAADDGRTLWLVGWAPLRRGLMQKGVDPVELYRTTAPALWTMAHRATTLIERHYQSETARFKLPAADEALYVVRYQSRYRDP